MTLCRQNCCMTRQINSVCLLNSISSDLVLLCLFVCFINLYYFARIRLEIQFFNSKRNRREDTLECFA